MLSTLMKLKWITILEQIDPVTVTEKNDRKYWYRSVDPWKRSAEICNPWKIGSYTHFFGLWILVDFSVDCVDTIYMGHSTSLNKNSKQNLKGKLRPLLNSVDLTWDALSEIAACRWCVQYLFLFCFHFCSPYPISRLGMSDIFPHKYGNIEAFFAKQYSREYLRILRYF